MIAAFTRDFLTGQRRVRVLAIFAVMAYSAARRRRLLAATALIPVALALDVLDAGWRLAAQCTRPWTRARLAGRRHSFGVARPPSLRRRDDRVWDIVI